MTTFRSNQMNRIFQLQFVEKAQTEFNIRLKNHKKGVWKPDAILASCYSSGKKR